MNKYSGLLHYSRNGGAVCYLSRKDTTCWFNDLGMVAQVVYVPRKDTTDWFSCLEMKQTGLLI